MLTVGLSPAAGGAGGDELSALQVTETVEAGGGGWLRTAPAGTTSLLLKEIVELICEHSLAAATTAVSSVVVTDLRL
jgi:hypothetical protein